jgi:hypothetical protein
MKSESVFNLRIFRCGCHRTADLTGR